MDLINAEIRVILKLPFVNGKHDKQKFRQINSILGAGSLLLQTMETWFDDPESLQTTPLASRPVEDLWWPITNDF